MTAITRSARVCPRCHARYEWDALFCPKDGVRLTDPESERSVGNDRDRYLGRVIAGDVAIQAVAGTGAMGRVYRARQRGIDRDVAVKILHRELSANSQLLTRFNREAKIASKLQHPHVVEVFLAGQLDDGALYTVMEFLDGASLAATIRGNGCPFTVERTLNIGLQICDAVGEAHVRGIVHRDLKPENIMLVRRADVAEWVKVLDFGIAKLTLGEQSMDTAAGLVFGTARYVSPEGAQGRPVGPPADVYAIATMLFELLAGRTPFEAEPLGLLIKHIHEAPPDLRSVNAHGAAVPAALAHVIHRNLCKLPDDRAQSGREFAAQLAKYKPGDYVPVIVKHFWDERRGQYRFDIERLGECDRPIDYDAYGSYEKSAECKDVVDYGKTIGFECSRRPFKALVTRCPWMARD